MKSTVAAAVAVTGLCIFRELHQRKASKKKLVAFNTKTDGGDTRRRKYRVCIVGAGLSGGLLAWLLAQNANVSQIVVFERRCDPR
jgi:uncharacterized NAD(P)/FAD-binding protein YdhS